MNIEIRLVRPDDSEAILKIYAPYIEESAVSFELQVPAVEDFKRRIQDISTKYPYLVCCRENRVVGYAYASRHRERAAYDYDADASIYVDPAYHGKGIAASLYQCLFCILSELGFYNVYACYTVPNIGSERFHKKMGFETIGTFHRTGFKFGKWHDTTWMEKCLKDWDIPTTPIKSMAELPAEVVDEIVKKYSG